MEILCWASLGILIFLVAILDEMQDHADRRRDAYIRKVYEEEEKKANK